MTPREKALTAKNTKHWKGRIDKLEARDDLTEAEGEELAMRKAQLVIWVYQLKHASVGGEDASGGMSASSSAEVTESAGAEAVE